QVVLLPHESSMPAPAAEVDLALQRQPARASLRRYSCVHKDAIVANRPRVLDRVTVVPSGVVLRGETKDLLTSVAWPRLRKRATRVVVAVGLPELGEQLRWFVPALSFEVAAHDLHVLLRHSYSSNPAASKASSRLEKTRHQKHFPPRHRLASQTLSSNGT